MENIFKKLKPKQFLKTNLNFEHQFKYLKTKLSLCFINSIYLVFSRNAKKTYTD